jgi:hypothetical protein
MALPASVEVYQTVAVATSALRIRRCTFRRLNRIDLAGAPIYEVSCLYPDRQLPLPLGDLEMSAPICADCAANHIFRPDED